MDPFARIVIGYHGCSEEFARDLLLGVLPVRAWKPSTNDWDWLGHGIYFWEHSPERAFRWAKEEGARRGFAPAVVSAVIQLGRCFDLLNEAITLLYSRGIPAKLMSMEHIPSPRELAEKARRVLEAAPMTSREHWEFLIQQGIIDRDGRVLVNRLFGEQHADQTDATTPPAPSGNGSTEQPKQP